jgi:hypothetical protein
MSLTRILGLPNLSSLTGTDGSNGIKRNRIGLRITGLLDLVYLGNLPYIEVKGRHQPKGGVNS